MCGVIGLRCERDRADLGAKASALLRMLEYRGYDSTGAAIQSEDGQVVLRKDVGSPTVVTHKLGVDRLSGRVFCGQVRWATFGVVDRANAQPHEVRCKTHLYGAHNGNITNCDRLKRWLQSRGHRVLSDNDGEMLVHTVEHFFALELARASRRDEALKRAVLRAARKLVGSYAAVVVDPETQLAAAIKAGSSLYMGAGDDPAEGAFIIASSDLASVLSLTKVLLPVRQDEFALYDHARARFFHLRTGRTLRKTPVRSTLRVDETELRRPFKHFMHQEIFSQPDAVRKVLTLFLRRSPALKTAERLRKAHPALSRRLLRAVRQLGSLTLEDRLQAAVRRLVRSEDGRQLLRFAARASKALRGRGLESSLGGLLTELPELRSGSGMLDALVLLDEADDVGRRLSELARWIVRTRRQGGAVRILACGTSYHAAKVASVFFNRIAGVRVEAMLPGDFRAEGAASVRDGDLFIGISQSGETKDLIDAVDLVRASRRKACVATIVNNVNSTLALEKADLSLPLFCGPEVAVPATKSFMNQLAVLYVLALKTGEKTRPGPENRRRLRNLDRVPALLEETLRSARETVERAARDLHLAPSIHILATGMQGVAKEGALKVREVVLNHTEGYEASEFKHGPNTILGVNTVFGLDAVRHGAGSSRRFSDRFRKLYANYPLVFVTGPGERDVNLTISQINTHKIRGTDIFMIAEEDRALREAVSRPPPKSSVRKYRSGFVRLPRTGDDLLPIFTASAVLQLLALRMSVRKLALLDRLGVRDHGVHPDSPKNVSKSITVD